nr:hypothetical protein [Tanacetum cinerariifolium]
MQKVVEDVGEDDDFKSGAWVSATNYVNAYGGIVTGCLGDIKNNMKKGKLEQVVAIFKSCSPNVLGDLTVTMKDLSCTIPRIVHYKVIGEGGYGKDITVGAAMILANVSELNFPRPFRKGTCYIDSSFIERPRSRDWGQRLLGMSCDGAVYLAVTALAYHVLCVFVHSWPE